MNLKLLVNPFYKIINVLISDDHFPVILMKPYSEYGFKLSDTKNRISSTNQVTKFFENNISVNQITTLLDECLSDFSTIIKNKIILAKDSINLAFTENGIRLFLNDLGACKQEKKETEANKLEHICDCYVDWLLAAFVNSISESDYQLYDEYFSYKSENLKELKAALRGKLLNLTKGV